LFFLDCQDARSLVLEKTIGLPDSLGSLSWRGIAYSTRDNCILVWLYQNRRLVIDAATGRKVANVPAYGPGAPIYDPIADEVRLSPSEPGAHADAHRDSVLSTLAEVRMERPQEMCLDPVTNRVYCYLDDWGDSMTVLDGRTLNVIASMPNPRRPCKPRALCCNPRMHRVYWTRSDDDSALMVTDGWTNRTIATVEVGDRAAPLCYNRKENKLYVRGDIGQPDSTSENGILVLDCRRNRVVASIPVAFYGDYMCYNARENKVYGAGRGDSNVVVIDGASDRMVARIRVPGEAYDLAYDSTSNRLYCCGEDWVAAVDCSRNAVVGSVRTSTIGHEARAVFCAQVNKLYYLQWGPYEVYAVDCARLEIENRATVGYYVGAMFYNSRQDKVYCANSSGDAVAVIDAAAESVRSIVQVGRMPWALCSNRDGTRVYCANAGSGSVSVIDGLADTVVASVVVRQYPVALCYSTRRDKAYCASADSTTWVIDCRTNRVVKELLAPSELDSRLIYDPIRDRVYVTTGRELDMRVTVIDARRDSVIVARAAEPWPSPATPADITAKLGTRAAAIAYAPKHRRVFAATDLSRVAVFRVDSAIGDEIRRILRRLGEVLHDLWVRPPHRAERARPPCGCRPSRGEACEGAAEG
jgi:YVTN family beta-propeller protein